MIKPTYNEIKNIMISKGYKFFTNHWSINIVGIRTDLSKNTFNDTMCVLFTSPSGRESVFYFKCTTKAGNHWLLNPMRPTGTAIILEGQYLGVYKVGIHNRSRPSRSYEALEQIGDMKYVRDNNKNLIHELSGKGISNAFWGILKTNIHRASISGWSKFVDRWSAGCQVITGIDIESDKTSYETFMYLCNKSINIYGNKLSYTLLNSKDFEHRLD